MRVLFITATRLGDAVLSTGLLDHLVRSWPQARFTIACGPVAAGLFERLPRRERTLVMAKQRFDLHWLRLWLRCVTTRWDLAIDLRGSAVTLLLPARRRRVMRGGRRPGHRTRHLAAVLGLDPPPLPVVWTGQADEAAAAALLPASPVGPPFIALGPTANWSGKVWPARHFVALFREIEAALPGAVPVIVAGPGEAERAMATRVLEALPEAIDLCGRLPLAGVAAALRRCALFVGNDSGLMHLAAAAGTPTLGLFGPSRAEEYGPAGRCTGFVQAPGPSGTAPIADLSVAAVAEAALLLLERAGMLAPALAAR
ncbi:glycosyltransferase family 9 protein [Lichenicoccus sp.]|uniref:glycosyltransferase family 9 protein n=1 Tax=Lichenicoccus sp. TaxID=2781899 RepID=UPI003D1502EB